jgi:putative ABC transport system permease protein
MTGLLQDLRYAARSLNNARGFTFVAVLTLALGIGANTAIFSVIQALLLRPLPVPHAADLRQLLLRTQDQSPANAFSYPLVQALAARRDIFAGVFGFAATTFTIGEADAAEDVDGAWVTGEYYETLGIAPIAGRLLTPQDDRPGAPAVAVITEGYWQRRFAGNPNAIGQTMFVFGAPVTVVGVTHRGFTGTTVGRTADVTISLGAAAAIRPELARMLVVGSNTLSVMARQRAGLSEAQVEGRLAVAWPQIVEAVMPGAGPSRQRFMSARLDVVPGGTGWSSLRQRFGPPLLILMCVVGFVLLIACANVANLLLVRTSGRRQEIAVRLALGASRGRIARQLLTESAVLAAGGAAVGLLFAWYGSQRLLSVLTSGAAGTFGPSPGPSVDTGRIVLDVAPDATVLLFTMVLAVATVVLFGTVPAFGGANTVVRVGAKVTARTRATGALVMVQLALSLVLLICSGLFVRTLENLRAFDRGFDPHGVLLVEIDARTTGYSGPPLAALYEDLRQISERLPGVLAASFSGRTPLAMGETSYGFRVNGGATEEESLYHAVGPRYFETMGARLSAGREFSTRDSPTGPRVAVVNEAFARRHLPGQNPLGQRLSIEGRDEPPMEIVGVVKDVLFSGTIRSRVAAPSVYVPYAQHSPSRATFEITVAGSVPVAAASLRRAFSVRLPNTRIDVRSMEEQLDRALLQERLIAGFGSLFGGLALVLATIGLYGLLAYNVARRTSEIGVRTALGASRSDILQLVMRTLAAGVAIGLPLALMTSSMLSRMLFDVNPTDVWTAATAVAVLIASGAAAAYVPGRRAARVNPLVALRYE